ncbi:MAG: bifunctional serine/threonine-protein kinase/formylglycine-generating enzyme family protein [Polyangiaceae bacterium]|nr:bifunctional serine/threonine-protein kinase/formylglycine-generating enzyme family protein [Polyangiaceae bacterium]
MTAKPPHGLLLGGHSSPEVWATGVDPNETQASPDAGKAAEGRASESTCSTASRARAGDGPAAARSQGDSGSLEGMAARFLMAGDVVGRYYIRRLLGQGGMGQVYLARDMTLGRSVALKVLRRDVLGAAASERFIEEARAIASLNHPHIVQLYDVGDHDDSLYLALEYVKGETLQRRVAREELGVDDVLRIGRAIADALTHAHDVGIFHCDLKPGNIMLGHDGRLRVVDFGLARTEVTPVGARLEGTPDWMAPEQWAFDSLTDRVDVWALGLMMAHLLGGRHPFDDANQLRRAGRAGRTGRTGRTGREWVAARRVERDDLSPIVTHLIERSLGREPGERPTARAWYEALNQLVERRTGSPLEEAPFRGLAAFDERHAPFFFGRGAEIDAFLEELRVHPVLPIIGPSGAGKSSFLHAGVIPRLRARESTTVLAFRPGRDPLTALARAILTAGLGPTEAERALVGRDDAAALAHDLRETPTLIAARLATIAAARRAPLLVAVDQLEEVFTQGASEADARCFLELLFACSDDPRDPVRVTFTLRDDFLGRVPGLRALYVMRGLCGDELRQAVVGPMGRCGYHFDDDTLVDDMLAEIGVGRPADLPLLQFACRALWDGRDPERRQLRRATYERVGGVAGALARHADGVLEAAPLAERRAIPKLLLRLVAGTTRRSVERADLLAGLPPEAASALDRLLAARLIAPRAVADSEGASLEIAHESLLRSWAQLARWLDESREERRLLVELEDATTYWERRGRRPEETWPATELLAVRGQSAKLGLELPARVEGFLTAGERYQRSRRRRALAQRTALGVAGGLALVATLGLATTFRLAEGNVGQVDLVFAPFDLVDGRTQPVDLAALPGFTWQLYGAQPDNEHLPGAPLPPKLVSVEVEAGPLGRVDHVQAPGGRAAFLRIEGRGRAGESCAPSWLRLRNLPGYLARGTPPPVWRLEIPTCQASVSDTVAIEAGPFVFGGPGEPPTRFDDYAEPEETPHLEAFAIDRTEVSNARYQPFARLAAMSGYAMQAHPTTGLYAHDADPDMPATAIDAITAEAFCRYMGKALPGDHQWEKAARGGLTLAGKPNPNPRRLYPWGTAFNPACVNDQGAPGHPQWLAPVDSFACGASPYGVLNLAGNVSEWIARETQSDRERNPLRVIRGGDVESPRDLEHTTTVFRNGRAAQSFNLSVGLRCVLNRKEVRP